MPVLRSQRTEQHRQGLSEHGLRDTVFPGQHLELRKNPEREREREQSKMN